jgi:hypothetical protein
MTIGLSTAIEHEIIIEIGSMPIQVRTSSPEFLQLLADRYSGFVNSKAISGFQFDIELVAPGRVSNEDDIAVHFHAGRWTIERGDFHAEWEPEAQYGRVVQSANPYSIDTVLRIIHSLILAKEGGLLIHAASAVRNGNAFLFSGLSGAGKTTISRLAPLDVTLLTDEISYIRRDKDRYVAFGTPFAGELAKVGKNIHAPLKALYFLRQGLDNKVESMNRTEAIRQLMENVLFFAQDQELVGYVFESACNLIQTIPIFQLTFLPDERIWELIA